MPSNSRRDSGPQSQLLSAVRESQAAVIDVVRAWTDIGQQLTRDLRLPIARFDLSEAVDRVFDVAEQTLAIQRELAHTVVGVASRQLDTAVDIAVEAAEATAPAVEAVKVEAPRTEAPKAEAKVEAPKSEAKAEAPKRDSGKPDRRSYEERSIEELRERARELDIEGRSSMSKDELITALRKHSR